MRKASKEFSVKCIRGVSTANYDFKARSAFITIIEEMTSDRCKTCKLLGNNSIVTDLFAFNFTVRLIIVKGV